VTQKAEARGREVVGSGELERGADCGFLHVREGGSSWGRGGADGWAPYISYWLERGGGKDAGLAGPAGRE